MSYNFRAARFFWTSLRDRVWPEARSGHTFKVYDGSRVSLQQSNRYLRGMVLSPSIVLPTEAVGVEIPFGSPDAPSPSAWLGIVRPLLAGAEVVRRLAPSGGTRRALEFVPSHWKWWQASALIRPEEGEDIGFRFMMFVASPVDGVTQAKSFLFDLVNRAPPTNTHEVESATFLYGVTLATLSCVALGRLTATEVVPRPAEDLQLFDTAWAEGIPSDADDLGLLPADPEAEPADFYKDFWDWYRRTVRPLARFYDWYYRWQKAREEAPEGQKQPSSFAVAELETLVSVEMFHECAERLRVAVSNIAERLRLLLTSAVVGEGPKVIRLSTDEAVALSHVSLSGITMADYQQPFPTLVVAFSEDQDPTPDGVCSVILNYHPKTTSLMALIVSRNGTLTARVWDAKLNLELSPETAPEGHFSHREENIALNVALLLTREGWRRVSPEFPIERDVREKGSLRRIDSRVRERLRFEAQILPIVFGFSQDTVIYARETSSSSPQTEDGVSAAVSWHVAPHWRRGHWAIYWVGPKGEQRRDLRFRPAILVNAGLFVGPHYNTQVRIKPPPPPVPPETPNEQ